MARGWRVLDATSFNGAVGGARGRITFTYGDGHARDVPAEEVAVLLLGQQTQLATAALHYLAKHDIATLACDWRGVPFAGMLPWSDHGRVGARHIAQSELSVPRRKNAWMQVVRAKIRGQAEVVSGVDSATASKMRDIAESVRSGDPSNAEAQAARLYWSRMFPEQEFRRDTDGGDEPNALLNYGYMVLRGHGIRAVLSAGLSPTLGLFHRGRSNYFNLVDDLIEPFRPAIDHVAMSLGPGATLTHPAVKNAMVSAASQPFTADGRRIPSALEDLAQQLGQYVEGDVERLVVTPWTGPKAAVDVPTIEEFEASGRDVDSEGDPPW